MLDPTLTNARILMVDDQESNLLFLQSALEGAGYADLKCVNDARQTLAALEEFQPDLILLDLHMPHLDGLAVMEQLRARIPPDDYLPILVLTADVTTEAKLGALGAGARDFLTKPLDVAEVTLRVRNLLETRSLHLQLQKQNQLLEEKVMERTADLERQFHRLSSLREVDRAIAGALNVNVVLDVFLKNVLSELTVDAAVVLFLDPYEQRLKYALGRGLRTPALQFTNLRLGEGYAGRAALSRRTVRILDLQGRTTDFLRSPTFAQEGFVSYFGVPLVAKGEIKGVLEIFHRAPLVPGTEWLDFLESLAGQLAIAFDNAALYNNLQRSNIELSLAYDDAIEGWSRAMDLRDKETEGHTQRVTELTLKLARASGMKDTELVHVKRGALLHDMGKLGVPDSILLKPGKLTDEEWDIMRQHPQFAYDMLSPIAYLRPALDIPFCHHEKWDGSGYPRGLKGAEIPLPARLFAVVDVWDALRSDRPYRAAWPEEKVLEHIRSLSGTHFEPHAVELFLHVIRESG